MELAFHWQGVGGCLCGVGPYDSPCHWRVRQIEEGREMGTGALCPGLGGDSEDGQEGSDVRGLGENPWDSVDCLCGCQRWD